MLLGYRVSQKSVLWPLVAVMLPGWLLLVALVHNPVTDGHAQMALRARVARQMFAHEHASTLAGSPPGRAAIDSLYRQVREAGAPKARTRIDTLISLGRKPQLVVNVAIVDGIHAARHGTGSRSVARKARAYYQG